MELSYANNPKSLFRKYAKLITWFANTQIGRDYLSIKDNKTIELLPNAHKAYLDHNSKIVHLRSIFYPTDFYAEKLGPALSAIDIASNWIKSFRDSQEAFAYYLGLRYASQFPRLFFAQTTFNALSLDDDIQANNATYATAHDATTGALEGLGQIRNGGNGTVYIIRRFFCRWDTSALTADATITAADVSLYASAKQDSDSTGVDIVQSTATDGQLIGDDYNNLGTTVYATKTLANVTTSARNAWALDATGRADISKTANTKFAWRISQDTTNTAPSTINADNSLTFQLSGEANPEQLIVTYTLPAAAISGYKSLLGVGQG